MIASRMIASQMIASRMIASQVIASQVIASRMIASQVIASQVIASQINEGNWVSRLTLNRYYRGTARREQDQQRERQYHPWQQQHQQLSVLPVHYSRTS
mgnify:CR=1 FL=1|jgi:hypothetical protein